MTLVETIRAQLLTWKARKNCRHASACNRFFIHAELDSCSWDYNGRVKYESVTLTDCRDVKNPKMHEFKSVKEAKAFAEQLAAITIHHHGGTVTLTPAQGRAVLAGGELVVDAMGVRVR